MQRSSIVVVAAVAVAGCTPKLSGPELWRRACVHAKTLRADAEIDVEACRAEYQGIPAVVADDLARCVLHLDAPDEDGSRTRACVHADTQAFLAKADESQKIVDAYAKAIDAHRAASGKLPASLAELGPSFSGRDAWGNRLGYAPNDEHYALCSAGYDGEHSTGDDLCSQPFISFQF